MSNTRENTLAALAAAAFLGLLAGEAAVSGDGFVVNSTERSQASAEVVAAVRLAHHDAELPACAR